MASPLASGTGSATNAVAITPNDSTDLTSAVRAIYVGSGGDLKVWLVGDAAAVTFSSVPTGTLMPIIARRVYATGTTAASLIGLT